MARYLSDQNKVGGLHESGTYGEIGGDGSAFWIGQVQSHDINDDESLIETRYLGTATRNFDTFIQGPINVTGALNYNPQDMRLVFWSIGSTYNNSGTTDAITTVTEIDSDVRQSAFTSGPLNPPTSFTLEDSKQAPGTGRNFIRTVKGIVPNITTLTLTQGEKVVVNIDYLAQSLTPSSGTTSTFEEITRRPYLWSDSQLTINGSNIDTTKEVVYEVNQNRENPHYITGSREPSVPYNGNRDHTVTITVDWEGTHADMLYNEFYKGGSKFNMTIDLNADSAAGSQHTTFYYSGCYIITPTIPSPLEDITETTIEIRPESMNGEEYNFFTSGMQINPF